MELNNTLTLLFHFVIICGFASFYWIIITLQKRLSDSETKMVLYHQEVRTLIAADVQMGKKLIELKTRLDLLDVRQDQLETTRPTMGAYTQALKLLDSGAKLPEIMQQCNISAAEAELLKNLQSYQEEQFT